jgi:hypothetical protein
MEEKPDKLVVYMWKDNLLWYKGRVVVPPEFTMKPCLLKKFHDTKTGGHLGVLRTWKRIAQAFNWNDIKKNMQNYAATCNVCQRNKVDSRSPAGLLQPLLMPS